MKKSLALCLATAVASTVVLTPGAASAVAPVTAKDVPSLKQVKKVFPGFGKKSVRKTYQNTWMVTPVGGTTCKSGERVLKGKSGVSAIYWSRPNDPYGKMPRATVDVVRFKKVATAKKVIKNHRNHERACLGQAVSRELVLNPIGDDRYALRSSGGAVMTQFANVWVRKGRTVVQIQTSTAKPASLDRINRIARVALERAR